MVFLEVDKVGMLDLEGHAVVVEAEDLQGVVDVEGTMERRYLPMI